MYTEADFKTASYNARIRIALGIAMIIAFTALMIMFNSMRNRYLSCGTAAVGFMVTYFVWSFKISPWIKYNRHLKDVKTGQRRTTACDFVAITPETRIHDGVEVHDFVVTVGPEEEDERLFYWDSDKPQPTLCAGDKLTVISYGNFVIDLKTEPADG